MLVWRSSQPSACKWSEGYGKNIYIRERVSNCVYLSTNTVYVSKMTHMMKLCKTAHNLLVNVIV